MGNYVDGLMACRGCGHTEFIRKGYEFRSHQKTQRWQCKSCGRVRLAPRELELKRV